MASILQHNRAATFTITGVKEIDRALKALEPKVAKKVLRKALRESLKPVKARVEQLAPRGPTGQTAKKVKILAATRTRKKVIKLRVVIGKGYFIGEQFYASFTELGTKRSGRGFTRGFFQGKTRNVGQKAQHFMKRAYEQTKDQAKATAVAEIKAGIEREASR